MTGKVVYSPEQLEVLNSDNPTVIIEEMITVIDSLVDTHPEIAEHFLMRLLAALPENSL